MATDELELEMEHEINELRKLLKEAIELLKYRVDPRHSKQPRKDEVRCLIARYTEFLNAK